MRLQFKTSISVEGQPASWAERRWLVRSVAYALDQGAALERRLATAARYIQELVVRKQGKKPLFHAERLVAAVAIVKREGSDGLLSYTPQARRRTRPVRAYRDRPARQESDLFFQIEACREEALIEQKKREMGWQVYATNGTTLSLAEVVWEYRGQYRVEDDWSRMKGRPLGLTPL